MQRSGGRYQADTDKETKERQEKGDGERERERKKCGRKDLPNKKSKN